MRPGLRTVAGAILAGVAILGIAAASRAPWTAVPADRALVRLSWRAQSETTEKCRPLSEEEQAQLPVHMRVPEVCERRAVPYSLRVAIDGTEVLDDTIHGAGAREDRPIYVFRELALTPGRHALDVEFAPIRDGEEISELEEGRDEEYGERETRPLKYSETIVLGDREVALVTYDGARRALIRVAP